MNRLMSLVVVGLMLGLASLSYAQGRPGGGGGPGGGGPGGGGMMGGVVQQVLGGQLQQVLRDIGDASLTPGFELTKDQKEKIQAIREEHRKAVEKWVEEHKDDIKKLREQMAGMFGGGNRPDPEKIQELRKAGQDLTATAPKSDEAAKQVKAVLTEEQAKQLEAFRTQRDADQKKLMEMVGMQPGGGPGGPPNPPPPGN